MKFVYVLSPESRDELLAAGYVLLKEDKNNKIWVFENAASGKYSMTFDFPHVLSDVLTF